jgi:hypothetical protein
VQITDNWRKSTKSPDMQNCAEVRRNPENDRIEIRNSKAPLAGTASFTDSEWIAFTDGVEAGEFEIE